MARHEHSPPRLSVSALTKSYGGVHALADVDLDVQAGEVHALVGENGAGKSTLIKIACGIVAADSGTISIDGRQLALNHPQDARAAGIAVVHQEAELFPHLSVTENMLLAGGFPTWGPFIRWRRAHAQAARAIEQLGETLPVTLSAGRLSVAHRMLAEIAAAVDQQARVLFLDEPTASLTARETARLFEQIRRLASQGVGVVYVSHRLEEIKSLCDRVTVLRDGRRISATPIGELSIPDLVTQMVGRRVETIFPKTSIPGDEELLRLDGLTASDGRFADVSLHVHRGEIVALYGLIGAGRTELAEAVIGLRHLRTGQIMLAGQTYVPSTPTAAMRAGIAYLPEDRLVHGIFPRLAIYVNALITVIRDWSRFGYVDSHSSSARADAVMNTLHVRRRSGFQPVHALSGGNQQKVVFSRWLLSDPQLFLLDEPTRGIDVRAKTELHQLINDWAGAGKSIVLITSDLPEALGMSDRLIVFRAGRVASEFDPAKTDETQVAQAALPRGSGSTSTTAEQRLGWSDRLRSWSLVAALALLTAVLMVVEPDKFASLANFQDVAAAAAIPFFLALGATLVIASGGIDISVGSILAVAAAICGLALNNGWSTPAAMSMAIGVGAALGALNAAVALLGRIHPIVVTLAAMGIYRGLLRVITSEKRIQGFPESFRALTEDWWWHVRPVIWYALVAVLLGTLLLRFTRTGRSLLAVGDSPTAATLIGLNRARLQLLAFGINGALAGFAGVLWAASYGIVDTYTAVGWELKAIAAAVVGGCLITGGTGTAWGAAVGAVMLELIRNALVILGVSAYWEGFFVGLLILLVVFVDARLKGADR